MKIIPTSDIQLAINILQTGGVIAHATETCYGLACDITNPKAIAKLFAIKKRPEHMPVSALFESINQAKQYLAWNTLAEELAQKHLPGPLTIILNQKLHSPNSLNVTPPLPPITNPNPLPPTIGLRISSHPTAQNLVAAFGSPLSTTSANIHSQPNPYSVENLLTQFTDADIQPDLILDDGTLERKEASTVVDCSEGIVKVVREGDIKLFNIAT